MFHATSMDSTLALNPSNHDSIPPEGLELEAGMPTPVTPEQASFLRSIGVTVIETPDPKPLRAPRGASTE